ncbi:FAD linked oxidase domain protein [Agrobacterium sp. ATCC 31749]|uniref:FAD-binding oxidoreductase n=1 Tax=unclassified Agrobacterium TaxID=2632611 RepID=UPI00020DC007|nr:MULTISPECIES: FAD-binding oxidoreductase [unclassified Agrobacterium]EGL65193.1 FAD linked oxidase domain protein [Agrobacterium sp. ATCC 31749]QKX00589.1 FAD-binding protein [Agrobacterium sp. CGMCC 11546]
MQKIDSVLLDLPAEVVTKDQDIVSSYVTDFRRQYFGATTALLRPRNTAEVQAIIRACAKHKVGLVPQGGNTSYCAAATPNADGQELLISLERMNRLRDLDPGNLSVTADAGIILSDLQRAADDVGLLLPLALGSQQSCRIGGNLSTNAGGTNVVRYGMARDLVLGLEAVLPDGSLFSELNPLRKNNSGYDVKQLFVGAEGTLGVITGVSLKLARKPSQTITAFLAVRDIASLVTILDAAQIQNGEAITSFEYISSTSLNLLLSAKGHLRNPLGEESAHYILLEAATSSPVLNLGECMDVLLAGLFESGLISDGTIAASKQQRADLWHLRETIPEAEVHHGGSVKHDIAVRTSRLATFIESACQLIRSHRSDAILSVYGHVGDGNVHFNILSPEGHDKEGFKRYVELNISPEIYKLAFEMGGTFSAEYGIGRVKLDLLRLYGAEGKIDLMKRIKTAIDPHGLLNPNKVIP